jgi:hypothetical protein
MENLCVGQNHIFQLVEVWRNFTQKKNTGPTSTKLTALDGDRPPSGGEKSFAIWVG